MSIYMSNGVPTAPNGMNLSRSVGNPKSRFERIRSFIKSRGGKATKREILLHVFGKFMTNKTATSVEEQRWQMDNGIVSSGYATYVFGLGRKNGYFTVVRKNRTAYWVLVK